MRIKSPYTFKIFVTIAVLTLITIDQASALVSGASDEEITIRSNFSGGQLFVFGAFDPSFRDKKSGIIVLVTGPSKNLVIRKKESTKGIWINRKAIKFENVPTFYSIHSNDTLEELLNKELLEENGLGLNSLSFDLYIFDDEIYSEFNSKLESDNANRAEKFQEMVRDFERAIVRNKQKDNLYSENQTGVQIIDGRLFKAVISIPTAVPLGNYLVQTFLVQNEEIIRTDSFTFYVQRSQLENFIYLFAHRHSILYGLIAVLLAMFFGITSAELFRRIFAKQSGL